VGCVSAAIVAAVLALSPAVVRAQQHTTGFSTPKTCNPTQTTVGGEVRCFTQLRNLDDQHPAKNITIANTIDPPSTTSAVLCYDNPADPTVTCTTGLPLPQPFMLGIGDGANGGPDTAC
jgi:hypothetical protein